jgi:hypothetical protein
MPNAMLNSLHLSRQEQRIKQLPAEPDRLFLKPKPPPAPIPPLT